MFLDQSPYMNIRFPWKVNMDRFSRHDSTILKVCIYSKISRFMIKNEVILLIKIIIIIVYITIKIGFRTPTTLTIDSHKYPTYWLTLSWFEFVCLDYVVGDIVDSIQHPFSTNVAYKEQAWLQGHFLNLRHCTLISVFLLLLR